MPSNRHSVANIWQNSDQLIARCTYDCETLRWRIMLKCLNKCIILYTYILITSSWTKALTKVHFRAKIFLVLQGFDINTASEVIISADVVWTTLAHISSWTQKSLTRAAVNSHLISTVLWCLTTKLLLSSLYVIPESLLHIQYTHINMHQL